MIDKLVLHIPFHDEHLVYLNPHDIDDLGYVPVKSLKGVRLVGNIEHNEEGGFTHSDLRTVYESLPSSHAGMAVKIFNEGSNTPPFVSIKCSPAKLLQGHNLCGFDDLAFSALNMLHLLSAHMEPVFSMLDIAHADVSELDITYSIQARNQIEKMSFIDFLLNTSKGQTKRRGDGYATTGYFGAKNSLIKKLKFYSKYEEMLENSKEMLKKGFKNSANIISELTQTDYAKKSIRFESTIKRRFLQRRNIPTNLIQLINHIKKDDGFYINIFKESWKDIFEALKGQEIKIMNDTNVYEILYKAYSKETKTGNISTSKVERLNNFYITLKSSGFYLEKEKAKKNGKSSIRTFERNVKSLVDAGISLSVLQNLNSETGATILPFPLYFNIDFSNQHPAWYKMPPALFDDDFKIA